MVKEVEVGKKYIEAEIGEIEIIKIHKENFVCGHGKQALKVSIRVTSTNEKMYLILHYENLKPTKRSELEIIKEEILK